jgi:hypothetical protein
MSWNMIFYLGQKGKRQGNHVSFQIKQYERIPSIWKAAPDSKIIKRDVSVAKNYLNEKELYRLNRIVTMFIYYAELMAEDEVLMSMADWLSETDRFLTNNRRKVFEGKGRVSRSEQALSDTACRQKGRQKWDGSILACWDALNRQKGQTRGARYARRSTVFMPLVWTRNITFRRS